MNEVEGVLVVGLGWLGDEEEEEEENDYLKSMIS